MLNSSLLCARNFHLSNFELCRSSKTKYGFLRRSAKFYLIWNPTDFICATQVKEGIFKPRNLLVNLLWFGILTVTCSSKGRLFQPLHQKVIQWVKAINSSALKSFLLLQKRKSEEETLSKPEVMVDWVLFEKSEKDELMSLVQRVLWTKIFEWGLVGPSQTSFQTELSWVIANKGCNKMWNYWDLKKSDQCSVSVKSSL